MDSTLLRSGFTERGGGNGARISGAHGTLNVVFGRKEAP